MVGHFGKIGAAIPSAPQRHLTRLFRKMEDKFYDNDPGKNAISVNLD